MTDGYNENGYIRMNSYFSEEFIDKVNKVIDNLDVKGKDGVFYENKTDKVKQIQYLQKYDSIFYDIIDKLVTLNYEITGYSKDDVELLNMQLFEKHPQISKPTRSHQDNAYLKITPTIATTYWISLDDIDEENGCLYYAPKTHITPTRKHQRYHKHTTFRTRSGVPGLSLCLHEHPEETDLPMITKKGDLLVHNCNLIHRAGKNNSINRRRRAIGVVFIPKNCEKDMLLEKYHLQNLKKDIELQEVKDPNLYRELRTEFSYLWENI